jgi:hypothetical protein
VTEPAPPPAVEPTLKGRPALGAHAPQPGGSRAHSPEVPPAIRIQALSLLESSVVAARDSDLFCALDLPTMLLRNVCYWPNQPVELSPSSIPCQGESRSTFRAGAWDCRVLDNLYGQRITRAVLSERQLPSRAQTAHYFGDTEKFLLLQ